MSKKPLTAIGAYLASIGRKGGSAKGPSKRRGDTEYYRELARKAAEKRKAKP